jgi:hypothetical protein
VRGVRCRVSGTAFQVFGSKSLVTASDGSATTEDRQLHFHRDSPIEMKVKTSPPRKRGYLFGRNWIPAFAGMTWLAREAHALRGTVDARVDN